MGIHIHHARHIWRSLLRFVPPVLRNEFWRGLLGVDCYTVQFYHTGNCIRIQIKTQQYTGTENFRSVSLSEWFAGSIPDWSSGCDIFHRRNVQTQHDEPGTLGNNLVWPRSFVKRKEPCSWSGSAFPRQDKRLTIYN